MKKKKFSAWGVLVVFMVFISTIIALIQHNNPLPDYRGSARGQDSSSEVSSKPTQPAIEMVQYTNENPPFTINVPAGWTKIVKSGYMTWVDKASASSFQIQIGASDPAILEVTRDSVAAELAAVGAELVNFYWMDEWNFACMYRTFTEAGSVANIEITAFNKRHIVRFVFMINESYYNQIEPTVAQMIDSFAWDRFEEDN
jgi:hypothetical protein